MKNLTIGPSYFQNERRAYSDWKVAVFTEILQNAIDSPGCSRIDIDIISPSHNSTLIVATDNGAGMSRETLENVFLVVGETSKSNGGNTIGGYGIARNLICFGMSSYVIRSQDYVVIGCGASYEIEDSPDFVNGCIFEIETEGNADNWKSKLLQVISYSTITPELFINGAPCISNLSIGKHIRDLSLSNDEKPFAKVYVDKDSPPGLYVRCKGLKMFEKYLNEGIKARVFIDIEPDKAKEVLTSNRNEFKYEYSKILQEFLNELSCDSLSGLADQTKYFKKISKPGQGFKTTGFRKKEIQFKKEVEVREAVELRDKNLSSQEIIQLLREIKDPILEYMMILNKSEDIERVRLINNFYCPEKFTTRSSTRYQLLRQWFYVCLAVMDEIADWIGGEYTFSVGWIFSDNTTKEESFAAYYQEKGVHYLLINPINSDNKLRYSVNNKDDYYALIVLACHEATHCLYKYHDEGFSSFFTELQIRVLKKVDKIFRSVRECK